MPAPKVSVCIPTYNRADSLRVTLEAVLGQTFTDFELVICDDASTDDTRGAVKGYTDPRIRYHRNERNLGLYGNWNRCIELAAGQYISIYHDHDIYLPTILARSVALLDRHPSAGFVHTASLVIDPAGEPAGLDIRPFSELTPSAQMMRSIAGREESPVVAATAMVRTEKYAAVGGYQYEKYGIVCDRDMWFRLARVGDVGYVDEPQAFIRARAKDQETSRFRWADTIGSLTMQREHLDAVHQGESRLARAWAILRNSIHWDVRLVLLAARAALMEPESVQDEGEQAIKEYAGMGPYVLARSMRTRIARSIIRKWVLPRHYEQVAEQMKIREASATRYLEAHPELRAFLVN